MQNLIFTKDKNTIGEKMAIILILSDSFPIRVYLCPLKFMFSKKATKIDEIFTVDLTLTT